MERQEMFEDRLLAEMRHAVSERAWRVAPLPAYRTRRTPVRAGIGFATAAAIAVIATMVVQFGTGTPAAYAVSEGSDGTVRVEINRLSDADGLERQLEAHGINADVNYLPPGKACKQPRSGGSPDMERGQVSGESGSDGHFAMTLDPADFSGADRTLLIELSGPESATQESWTMVKIENAKGTVAPCEGVDAPTGPPPGAVTHFQTPPPGAPQDGSAGTRRFSGSDQAPPPDGSGGDPQFHTEGSDTGQPGTSVREP